MLFIFLACQLLLLITAKTLKQDACSLYIVESIPENVTLPSPSFPSTYQAWSKLIASAAKTIDIASFYWSLKAEDVNLTIKNAPSAWQGEAIFQQLLNTSSQIAMRIVISKPTGPVSNDTDILQHVRKAAVRQLDMGRFVFINNRSGNGILHTKFWVFDNSSFYVGSANMDFRSLTQVKELGIVGENCPELAVDIGKIFETYWYLSEQDKLPNPLPAWLDTSYNSAHPVIVPPASYYISSAPPPINPPNREDDLTTIVRIIDQAQHFVYIAVMDFYTTTLYLRPNLFFPTIDNALRRAAFERNVQVRVLASHWRSTRPSMFEQLRSLVDFSPKHISAALFTVPTVTPEQAKIPFCRVNHNKYMVTDNTAYVGTSNWSGDYFITTAGVGFVSKPNSSASNDTIRDSLEKIFLRDWHSSYASLINATSSSYLPLFNFRRVQQPPVERAYL